MNDNPHVQTKIMKLNTYITMATQMIEPEFEQAELFDYISKEKITFDRYLEVVKDFYTSVNKRIAVEIISISI